ncbi:MAG TPA: cytochrome c oxidase assembly factor Coa1 family protein [bacterium]|nr:cytochrome c oxidase assembly factor Coa1 family protein [bacterium]
MQEPGSSRPSRSWVKYVVLAAVAFFLLLCLTIGGILFFVFYQLKDSEPAKMAVTILRQSPVAQHQLGELQDTGWPIGNFSTDGGGSGKAAFSMSVKGSKAKGKYYASLYRQHGIWHYQSGRLEMADGRSLEIPGPGTGAPPLPPPAAEAPVQPPTASGSTSTGGRKLRHDADTTAWTEVTWPDQPIAFKVPPSWKQLSLIRREAEFRPEDRTAYFIGNATFFDQTIPYESLFPSLLQKSANQLERGEILGYARKDLGKAQGLLEIQQRGDGQTTAVWTGYFEDERYGTVSLTLLLGAPTPADFDKAESVLGAILESVVVR